MASLSCALLLECQCQLLDSQTRHTFRKSAKCAMQLTRGDRARCVRRRHGRSFLSTINSDSTREVSTAATRRASHQSCVTDLTSATNQFDLLAAIVHIGLAPTRLGRMCNRALKLSTHLDCV